MRYIFCRDLERGYPGGELREGQAGGARGGDAQLSTETVRCEVIYRAGLRHGLYRETRGGQLWTLGTFVDGEKAGPAWVRLRGDAFYMGELDAEINIQDEHGLCLYLYPDLVTLMVGEFSHGRLVSGHLSFVLLRLLSEAKMNE